MAKVYGEVSESRIFEYGFMRFGGDDGVWVVFLGIWGYGFLIEGNGVWLEFRR